MKQRVLCLLGFIGVVLGMSTSVLKARSSVTGGEHSIHIPRGRGQAPTWEIHHCVLDNSDLGLMEIQSADGSHCRFVSGTRSTGLD